MKKLIVPTLVAFATVIAFYACQKETKSNSLNGSSEEIASKKPGGGGGGGSSSTLDPLTLTCIGGVSGASIDVTVCAGASGASAGFSVQWETKADYDLYGWSSANAPSYCGASFSGVPGCKGSNKYSLGANGCVTVNIGSNLFDDCGASASCPNTACTTKDCGGEGCTYTQGYWKTHGTDLCRTGNNTNNWPADVLANGLTLGGVLYTADQLCSILNTPAGGTNLALAHQLIAVLLNIANGSSGAPQSCIDDANAWLASHGGVNGKQINSVLTDCLTGFNEGATGPGHCSN